MNRDLELELYSKIEILEQKLELAVEALESIAFFHFPEYCMKGYWKKPEGVEAANEILAQDTDIARRALKQIEELKVSGSRNE
jgi:hypothetical protein